MIPKFAMGEMGKYIVHGHRPESNLDKELPAQMEGPGRVVISNIRRVRQDTASDLDGLSTLI